MNKAFWLTAGFDLLVHCFAIEYINTRTHRDTSTNMFQMVSANGVRSCVSIVGAGARFKFDGISYEISIKGKRSTWFQNVILKSVVHFLLFEKCFLLLLLRSALLCTVYQSNWLNDALSKLCVYDYIHENGQSQQRRSILRKSKRLLLDTDT